MSAVLNNLAAFELNKRKHGWVNDVSQLQPQVLSGLLVHMEVQHDYMRMHHICDS